MHETVVGARSDLLARVGFGALHELAQILQASAGVCGSVRKTVVGAQSNLIEGLGLPAQEFVVPCA